MFLQGVPISALPSDIARLLKSYDIQGYLRIQRDYVRFWPTDSVLVTFGSLGERDKAIKALEYAKMLGINLQPAAASTMEEAPDSSQPSKQPRLRGREGKSELLDHGALSGDGPAAGLPDSESGKNVVLSGLPGKLYVASLRKELLEGFDLREDVNAVAKIPDLDKSLYSRFVIRTSSVAEAHRLVRAVKMTPYLEGAWGNRYKIKARVIY